MLHPPAYNEIEENDRSFILWKNFNHTSIATFPFGKDHKIFLEWGLGPDQHIRLRRMIYPKTDYELLDVMNIASRTESCPYCIKGVGFGEPIPQGSEDFLKTKYQSESDNMAPLASLNFNMPKMGNIDSSQVYRWLDTVWESMGIPSNVAINMNNTIVPAFVSKIPQNIFGAVSTDLGYRFLNGLVGIAGYATLASMNTSGRDMEFWGNFFANMISETAHASTNANASFAVNNDLNNLGNAIASGNLNGVGSSLFKPISAGSFAMPSLDSIGAQIQSLFGGFKPAFGGPSIQASPVTPNPSQLKMSPPMGSGVRGGAFKWGYNS